MPTVSGSNLPIRIQVEGGAQAEAAFNSVAATGERAMQRVATSTNAAAASSGNFRGVIGSAGYQLQDFAVQVQGGTSALTALSQQGSQFLGAFGPGGAIAGAALTVGILAAQILDLGDKIETTAEAEAKLRDAISASNEIFETAIDKANRLAQARIRAASLGVEERLTADRERLRTLNAQQADVEDRRAFARDRVGGNSTDNNPVIRAERERIAREAEIISQRIAEADAELIRLRAITAGGEQYGPNRPPDRTGSGGGGRAPSDRQGVDVNAAIEASGWARAQRDLNAYNQELNLNAAGLSGAAGALAAYERNMTTLNAALATGVIGEQQYAQEVEASSVALADQIEQIENRTERAGNAANSFGFTFNSALEDAILKGGELGNVLKALEQDLARMILRRAVTEPLGNAVSMGTNALIKSFAFADGGIMTEAGPVELRKYASGGIADSPQLALYGEGRMAEAYVPLPDGRSIPVTMSGGGGTVFAPTYTINAPGADASVVPRLRAEMQSIAAQSLAQFADSIQRGGAAARLVGRR